MMQALFVFALRLICAMRTKVYRVRIHFGASIDKGLQRPPHFSF
jgi:hypothetical protein